MIEGDAFDHREHAPARRQLQRLDRAQCEPRDQGFAAAIEPQVDARPLRRPDIFDDDGQQLSALSPSGGRKAIITSRARIRTRSAVPIGRAQIRHAQLARRAAQNGEAEPEVAAREPRRQQGAGLAPLGSGEQVGAAMTASVGPAAATRPSSRSTSVVASRVTSGIEWLT